MPRVTAGAAELAARVELLADRLGEDLWPLAAVAYNYRWSWSRDGAAVFRDVDPHGWSLSGQNPVLFLQRLALTSSQPGVHDPELRARIVRLADEVAADLARPDRPAPGVDGPIAFFCAEFGVHVSLPTYAGGLGILAGDVLKEASAAELVQAIRVAAAGRRYLSPPLSERAIQAYVERSRDGDLDLYATLTAREREVLHLAAGGHSNPEIALRLAISARTVETHRAHLMQKLGLQGQTDLVRYAVRRGILPG